MGFDTELENLCGGDKGKGTSGGPARLKVLIRHSGADRPVIVMKWSNVHGAKGAGHRHYELIWPTGDRMNLKLVMEGGSL